LRRLPPWTHLQKNPAPCAPAALQYEQANGRAVQVEITVDGATKKAYEGKWLVDAIVREKAIPMSAISYHPLMDAL
jgi:hypothetical protein